MINYNQLTAFRAVAEAGGFSRATEILQVSQSAVSQQIDALEQTLGTKLFDRLPRGIRLTASGETLMRYARRIAELNEEAERALREGRDVEGGRLAVGTSAAIGSYLLPICLGKFRANNPGVEIEVVTGHLEAFRRRLLDRTLDLVLTEDVPPQDNELTTRIFGQDHLIAIAWPGHPLASVPAGKKQPQPITARRLCAEALVLPDAGSVDRGMLDRALSLSGAQALNVALMVGSVEAIKASVTARLGLAVVSLMAAAQELASGRLVEIPVRDLEAAQPLHEVRLRNLQTTPTVEAFVNLVKTMGKGE